MLELEAQGAHFRSTVDPEQLAPLTWRIAAQRYRSEPGERREGKQQKDRRQAIEALGQPKIGTGMTQQTATNSAGKANRTPPLAISSAASTAA